MPKKHRLTGAQIRRLTPEKRLVSSLFSLSATQNGTTETQVACVVSKKVSARAVLRNRVKRRMREALRSLAPLPGGFSLVLNAKLPAKEASAALVREDVAALIRRLHSGK